MWEHCLLRCPAALPAHAMRRQQTCCVGCVREGTHVELVFGDLPPPKSTLQVLCHCKLQPEFSSKTFFLALLCRCARCKGQYAAKCDWTMCAKCCREAGNDCPKHGTPACQTSSNAVPLCSFASTCNQGKAAPRLHQGWMYCSLDMPVYVQCPNSTKGTSWQTLKQLLLQEGRTARSGSRVAGAAHPGPLLPSSQPSRCHPR